MGHQGIIARYRSHLPVNERTPVVTLNEGNTPLIRAYNVERILGGSIEIHLKCEGVNPTGSFKDRGMTVAVSKAVEEGAKAVICASTGNTSASAAAYAAKANLKSVIIIPQNDVALGKLSQAIIYGATVIAIEGNFDDALSLVRKLSAQYPLTLVNSINPYRIEGQKTGAFEICDELGEAPDYHFMPVGNAGNITAYWKGYREYHSQGRISKLPAMMGYQAAGAAPIVEGRVVAEPKTVATAIRIGNPASWKGALAAASESGGAIGAVLDDQILEAYGLLAKAEGVFVEPASAAGLAGLMARSRSGALGRGKRAVCVLTGHGLKDPNIALEVGGNPIVLPPKAEAVAEALGL